MGKIASSDLHLNGNFIFGNWGQLGRFLVQLTTLTLTGQLELMVYGLYFPIPLATGVGGDRTPDRLFDSLWR